MQRSPTPVAFLCLLGAALPIATAFGESPRYAADHAPSALGALEAIDLAHGAGTARLTVRRVWVGAAASFRSLLAYQMKYEGRPSSNAPDGPLSDSMTKALEQARADGRLHVGQSPEQRQRVIRECSQRAAELDRQARPMAAGEALDQSLKEASETGRLASGMDQAAYLHGMAQVVSRAVDLLEEASRSRQGART